MSTAKLQKLAKRARDLGLRLGSPAMIVARHESRDGKLVTGYDLVIQNYQLSELEELLEWLDYYVPTADEQTRSNYGPMVSEDDVAPKAAKGGAA